MDSDERTPPCKANGRPRPAAAAATPLTAQLIPLTSNSMSSHSYRSTSMASPCLNWLSLKEESTPAD